MFSFLDQLFEPASNSAAVARLLLQNMQVNVTARTLQRDIHDHPDHPSLLSISDVLDNYGIENITARFDTDKIINIPPPFITQVKGKRSNLDYFTVVNVINRDHIEYYDPEKHKIVKESTDSFLPRFTGLVLLAHAEESAGDKDFEHKVRNDRRNHLMRYSALFCLPVILALFCGYHLQQHGLQAIPYILYSTLFLLGSILGMLLILFEVDQHNPALKAICSMGKKVYCGAILQSKGSHIAGISWSTIGFFYFFGSLLLLLHAGIDNTGALFFLSWLSIPAICYVPFSIYYQWRIVKQWCSLCLSVQAILLLQFVLSITMTWKNSTIDKIITPSFISIAVLAYLIPTIALVILLPLLRKVKEGQRNKRELERLRHKPEVFESLLKVQKAIAQDTTGLGITIGNPKAQNRIIKVCNPYCGPCAKAHPVIEKLVQNNPDIQVQIIFTATNSENDLKALPVKHLLAIAATGDQLLTREALDDWYMSEKKDYKAFALRRPISDTLERQGAKLDAMAEWCRNMDIMFTPTYFINGHQLPGIYRVSDLNYFFST